MKNFLINFEEVSSSIFKEFSIKMSTITTYLISERVVKKEGKRSYHGVSDHLLSFWQMSNYSSKLCTYYQIVHLIYHMIEQPEDTKR